ncbi:hypothetical protein MCUN1_001864 [Malassezia cuniculi]|uniref:RRM domain-containing protein n=1 Tax=Malassezia cuniculi TaxID=948313 RepID=A0AAF0EYP3_9BASI|nr:hypothetical protein MCUN1_001864 [Malassezia cuniculi]
MSSVGGGGSAATVGTTVFVGSISPGVTDRWLTYLLQACGEFRSLKRVKPAFGFADFHSAQGIVRALTVLNGVELPSMGSESDKPPLKLVVKADQKTRRYLDEVQHTLQHTEADERLDEQARQRIKKIIDAMSDPDADTSDKKEKVAIHAHLKDLPIDAVPQSSRKYVLSEIEKFRMSAVERDAAERKEKIERELRIAREKAEREREAAAAAERTHHGDPEAADIEAEEKRRKTAREAAEKAAQEALHAYAGRERARIARWDELQRESALTDPVAAEASRKRALSYWDSLSEDAELAHESFWTDRRRWLRHRSLQREREAEIDAADRAAHEAATQKAAQDAERFLAEQEAAFASMPQATGLYKSGDGPLRLAVHREPQDAATVRANLLASIRAAAPDAKLLLVEDSIPDERDALFAFAPEWTYVDDDAIAEVYRPFVDTAILESVGERVEELVDVVIEQVKAHASADTLVEVLEPVLAEDAPGLVEELWRKLVRTTLSAAATETATTA